MLPCLGLRDCGACGCDESSQPRRWGRAKNLAYKFAFRYRRLTTPEVQEWLNQIEAEAHEAKEEEEEVNLKHEKSYCQ